MILYLDFETTSGDPKQTSLNPWFHCDVAGFSYALDDGDIHWVPYMHLEPEVQAEWRKYLQQLLDLADEWVNHNVKYDMHVSTLSLGIKLRKEMRYTCTLVASKILDSDRWNYGLDHLSKAWCGYDIDWHAARLKPYLHRNKDYGRIPHDILGEYANDDIKANRLLHTHLLLNMPDECMRVWDQERELTYVLYEAEQKGMPTRLSRLNIATIKSVTEMLRRQRNIDDMLGYTIDPCNTTHLFEAIVSRNGLDVLAYTKDKNGLSTFNPSFDKHALQAYKAVPNAPVHLITEIQAYRTHNTLNNMFWKPWRGKIVRNRIHPTYNQMVRTGRMSCKKPNMQQLSGHAKMVIVPRKGWSIISMDQSQIEFRLIAHYIEQQSVIDAYNANPDIDFHTWVAEMCGIARKPAKNVNFGIAFGEGERKLTQQLSHEQSIIEWADGDPAKIEERAKYILKTYHGVLSNLKPFIRAAAKALREKGYIKNWYGRHRHMPITVYKNGQHWDMTYKAFNAVIQSSAADLMKDVTVQLARALHGTQVHIIGQVHDELILEAPTEIAANPDFMAGCLDIMEHPNTPLPLSVPIRCSYGWSERSWKEASENAVVRAYPRGVGLGFLRS